MGMFDWVSGVTEMLKKPWDQLSGQDLARQVQAVLTKQVEFNDLFATKLYESLDLHDADRRRHSEELGRMDEARRNVGLALQKARRTAALAWAALVTSGMGLVLSVIQWLG